MNADALQTMSLDDLRAIEARLSYEETRKRPPLGRSNEALRRLIDGAEEQAKLEWSRRLLDASASVDRTLVGGDWTVPADLISSFPNPAVFDALRRAVDSHYETEAERDLAVAERLDRSAKRRRDLGLVRDELQRRRTAEEIALDEADQLALRRRMDAREAEIAGEAQVALATHRQNVERDEALGIGDRP